MLLDMFTAFLAGDLGYWVTLLYVFLFFTFGLTAFHVFAEKGNFKFKAFLKDNALIYALIAFMLIVGWEWFTEHYFLLFGFIQFGLFVWADYHKNLSKYSLYILIFAFLFLSLLVTAFPGILY